LPELRGTRVSRDKIAQQKFGKKAFARWLSSPSLVISGSKLQTEAIVVAEEVKIEE
jgi:hypothetical protein